MIRWFKVLISGATIACALVAGVFQAFSEFVMVSLDHSMRAGGIESMQIINREVFTTIFMVMLIGMSLVAPIMAGIALLKLRGPARTHILLGSAAYVVGVFAVTLLGNVPMNNALARLPFDSVAAKDYWETVFFPRWTFWNHVRTIGSVVAAAFYLLASHALIRTSSADLALPGGGIRP